MVLFLILLIMPFEIEIEPYLSFEELNIHIHKFESDCETVNRLYLIKQVMKTKNVGEACDYGYSYKNCL